MGVARVQSLTSRVFNDEEVRLLQAIADRVAMAVDNAKLYDQLQRSRTDVEKNLEKERHFSLLLQRALLPARAAVGEGYNVAVCYVPAFVGREVGGDFYDVFGSGEGRAGVLIGDVSGKGLEAASLAATTRSTLHAFVHEARPVNEVLTQTNSVLYLERNDSESFVTVFLVALELPTGEIAYSSAGHPPAAILRTNGSVEFLSRGGLPLGIMDGADYRMRSEQLAPGDKLVLYTDGVNESHTDSGQFDLEGVKRILEGHSDWSVHEVADNLIAAATDWADGRLKDDAGVVVVERCAPSTTAS